MCSEPHKNIAGASSEVIDGSSAPATACICNNQVIKKAVVWLFCSKV